MAMPNQKSKSRFGLTTASKVGTYVNYPLSFLRNLAGAPTLQTRGLITGSIYHNLHENMFEIWAKGLADKNKLTGKALSEHLQTETSETLDEVLAGQSYSIKRFERQTSQTFQVPEAEITQKLKESANLLALAARKYSGANIRFTREENENTLPRFRNTQPYHLTLRDENNNRAARVDFYFLRENKGNGTWDVYPLDVKSQIISPTIVPTDYTYLDGNLAQAVFGHLILTTKDMYNRLKHFDNLSVWFGTENFRIMNSVMHFIYNPNGALSNITSHQVFPKSNNPNVPTHQRVTRLQNDIEKIQAAYTVHLENSGLQILENPTDSDKPHLKQLMSEAQNVILSLIAHNEIERVTNNAWTKQFGNSQSF